MRFVNLVIHTLLINTYEQIDGYLDVWYDSMKAVRLRMAIRRANALFLCNGKQYHVIPVKLKKMWMTEYAVVTRETIKQNKKLKIIKPNFDVMDILELAVYTTPSKYTYQIFKRGIPKRKKI